MNTQWDRKIKGVTARIIKRLTAVAFRKLRVETIETVSPPQKGKQKKKNEKKKKKKAKTIYSHKKKNNPDRKVDVSPVLRVNKNR